ncbi:MAG: zinc-ribbon domain-containing protein [Proteobacteria bacterium]|nr:zinc-ribbon domain-containing protein [Pseudomonadota bacterium]
MEIVCQNCKAKFRISDEKLPPGRTASIKCPKCQTRMEIDTHSDAVRTTEMSNLEAMMHEVDSGDYDAVEQPFDYIQEGMETALLCEHDLEAKQKLRTVLERLNYHVVEAASARNALKYMRFHTYDLVILNITFDAASTKSNHVLQYLAHIPISVRRNMFVALLGKGFRTKDNMLAFDKSVNLIVSSQDIDDVENILKGALREHEAFYEVFKESLKKSGRV